MKKVEMKKVELSEQEVANIEAKRAEETAIQATADKISAVLQEDKMQLIVNPNSPLNNPSILVQPVRQ